MPRVKTVITKMIIFGFPVFLIGLEYLIRQIAKLEAYSFIGPSLASVGVGALIPLIEPKKKDFGLPAATIADYKSRGILLKSEREETFILCVWLFILVLILGWAFALYLSSKLLTQTTWDIPSLALGLISYTIGITFSQIKEVI